MSWKLKLPLTVGMGLISLVLDANGASRPVSWVAFPFQSGFKCGPTKQFVSIPKRLRGQFDAAAKDADKYSDLAYNFMCGVGTAQPSPPHSPVKEPGKAPPASSAAGPVEPALSSTWTLARDGLPPKDMPIKSLEDQNRLLTLVGASLDKMAEDSLVLRGQIEESVSFLVSNFQKDLDELNAGFKAKYGPALQEFRDWATNLLRLEESLSEGLQEFKIVADITKGFAARVSRSQKLSAFVGNCKHLRLQTWRNPQAPSLGVFLLQLQTAVHNHNIKLGKLIRATNEALGGFKVEQTRLRAEAADRRNASALRLRFWTDKMTGSQRSEMLTLGNTKLPKLDWVDVDVKEVSADAVAEINQWLLVEQCPAKESFGEDPVASLAFIEQLVKAYDDDVETKGRHVTVAPTGGTVNLTSGFNSGALLQESALEIRVDELPPGWLTAIPAE